MIITVCLSEYIFPPDSILSYKHSQQNQMTTKSIDSLSGWTQEQRLGKLSRISEDSWSNDKLQQQMSQKASLTIGIGPWHAHHQRQLDHSLTRPSAHGCRQLFYYVMLKTTWTVFPPAFKVCPSDQVSSPQISEDTLLYHFNINFPKPNIFSSCYSSI